jgi:hypothetical protein
MCILEEEEADMREVLAAAESRGRDRIVSSFTSEAPSSSTSNVPEHSSVWTVQSTEVVDKQSLRSLPSQEDVAKFRQQQSEAREQTERDKENERRRQEEFKVNQERLLDRQREAARLQREEENAARKTFVAKGCWMRKPRSKPTSSAFLRAVQTIGGGSWNRRYIWASTDRVLYGQQFGKPEKFVKFGEIESVETLSPDQMRREGAPDDLHSFGWRLEATNRKIVWAAPDETSRRMFVEFLLQYVARNIVAMQISQSINNEVEPDRIDDESSVWSDPAIAGCPDNFAGQETGQEEVTAQPLPATAEEVLHSSSTSKHRQLSGFAAEPRLHLSALRLFTEQIENLATVNRGERMLGVAIANGEGLILRASGGIDLTEIGKIASIVRIAERMHREIVLVDETRRSTGRMVSAGLAAASKRHDCDTGRRAPSTLLIELNTRLIVVGLLDPAQDEPTRAGVELFFAAVFNS